MCGIVGLVRKTAILSPLLTSLERLEYRGYDSSGIAVFEDQELVRYRSVGMLSNLRTRLPLLSATTGIGHTRWATHGAPHESNAHPHMSTHIAVVHNGIIENFSSLKKNLLSQGYEFESETDTEVIAHLLDSYYKKSGDIKETFTQALHQLEGNFAIACLVKDHPDTLFVARRGSPPLVIGYSQEGNMVSSDALGCIGLADTLSYLESDTWAIIRLDTVEAYSFQSRPIHLTQQSNPFVSFALDKGNFEHYMLKEIHEQASVLRHLIPQSFPSLENMMGGRPNHITLLGCGTSFYAGWVGKYYLEQHCPVTLELASEFHYRTPMMTPGLTIALSQSGETADTLKAMEYAQTKEQKLASIVNVSYSSLARLSHWVLETQAGPEVGVASTKSFVAQLWILLALAGVDKEKAADLPHLMEQTLLLMPSIRSIAKSLSHAKSILYLGRGPSYPLALEGALKMKELSYIHAEGMAAGELKHGPIALIDQSMPVIVLAPYDSVFDKTLSNLHEITAREGDVIVITDEKGALHMGGLASIREIIVLPFTPYAPLHPFLYALVLQLLAYYTALSKGCTIDKPRNLAKSVTVE
jgi:glucosamine--fructose-6-phosphate aminotransferase (isomerizing)